MRAAYFRYAGNHDVAAFMRALGFEMPAQFFLKKDLSPSEVARIAMQVSCHHRCKTVAFMKYPRMSRISTQVQ